MKTDISKENLYIKKIRTVVKSEMTKTPKKIPVDGRHSDAFVYILEGKCTYEFDDGITFTVNSGDIMYLPYESHYTLNVESDYDKYIFCDFEFDGVSSRKSDVFSPDEIFGAENMFRQLLKSYNSSSFQESMSHLYSIYGIITKTKEKTYLTSNTKGKIKNVKTYIDKNFTYKNLSVTSLAENANMSEVYFRKLFKSQFGISPSQYIIAKRIKKAKELMKYPFITLEECAIMCGFSSLQYFGRVFKNTVGITPAKYRKQ